VLFGLVYLNPSLMRDAAVCAGQTVCACGVLQSKLAGGNACESVLMNFYSIK